MVRFATQLEELMPLDATLFSLSIDVEGLSLLIKTSRRSAATVAKDFVAELHKEVNRLAGVYTCRVQALKGQCETMLRRTAILSASAVDTVVEAAISLEKFVALNRVGIIKLVRKCVKHLKVAVPAWEDIGAPFLSLQTKHHGCILLLASKLYTKAKGAASGGQWVPPESFSRSTTKYLIPENRAFELALRLSRVVPVLCFDPTAVDAAQSISSVYYDGPTMPMYVRRLAREEGAQLLRVRWYNELSNDCQTFVERKTHHESWVSEDSVKERFPVPSTHIHRYLYGEWDPAAYLSATTLQERALAKSNTLAAEVLELVKKNDLRPAVRTVYQRVAFQETSNNNVRISLDWQLCMVKEDINRPKHWVDIRKECVPSDTFPVPYAVLEIKLQGEAPPELDTIIEDMMPVRYKFSKYLTGCAVHFPELVSKVPEWWDDPAMADAIAKHRAQRERDASQGLLRGIRAVDMMESGSVSDEDGGHSPGRVSRGHGVNAELDTAPNSEHPNTTTHNNQQHPRMNDTEQTRRALVVVQPKTLYGSERLWLGWQHQALLILIFCGVVATLHPMKMYDVFHVCLAVLLCTAGVTMLYALTRFYYRHHRMGKRAADGYGDVVAGPVLALVVLCTCLVMVFSVMFTNDTVKGNPFGSNPDGDSHDHRVPLQANVLAAFAGAVRNIPLLPSGSKIVDAVIGRNGLMTVLTPISALIVNGTQIVGNTTLLDGEDAIALVTPSHYLVRSGAVRGIASSLITSYTSVPWHRLPLPRDGTMPTAVATDSDHTMIVLTHVSGSVVEVVPRPPRRAYELPLSSSGAVITAVTSLSGGKAVWYDRGQGAVCRGHLGTDQSCECRDVPAVCWRADVVRWIPERRVVLCATDGTGVLSSVETW
eukprot:PhM_4_TR335/c0_g1_i1/m.61085